MSLKEITNEYKLIESFNRYENALSAANVVVNDLKSAIEALKQEEKYEEIATESEKNDVNLNDSKCVAFLGLTESEPIITCDENQCKPAKEVSNG